MATYDIVIIGGGPAGYTAALYAARAGKSAVVLEKTAPGGQMATTDKIDNYPGFPDGINGFELAMNMKKGAERFGVKTITSEVMELFLNEPLKTVVTKKDSYEAKNVIIAAGSRPRPLGIEREKEMIGKGISYCATCDGMFFKGKDVAVVGGGNTAVADVQYLANICKKVYLIHRRKELRAPKIFMEKLTELKNMELVLESEVTQLIGDRLSSIKVKSVQTGEKELAVNALFVAVGNIPNSEFLQGKLDLDEYGYIIADESTRTNLDGVFAAGDIRTKELRQVVTAVADGANAAMSCLE